MSSLHESHVSQKPIEVIHPNNLPEASRNPENAAAALSTLVEHSTKHDDVQHGIHAPMHKLYELPFVQKLIPGIEDIASQYHVGNYVAMRGTGEKFFESMPIYPRLGMHLLFYGGTQVKVLHNQSVESVLKSLSVRQGEHYDAPESVRAIPSFIATYGIQVDELAEPDISKYKTFNEFFFRKLRPDARPVQHGDDPKGLCSAADCRLTVYPTVDLAKQIWIKGTLFNVPQLLNVTPDSTIAKTFEDASIACFRLAPADYHRFHSPVDAVVGDIVDIPGQYYTVNPQAVNEPGFDVFTANKRSVLYLTHKPTGTPVAFVAIGAMLVGSIVWTKGAEKGAGVARGDELGYFAYGGSTIVALFPKGFMEFDKDLLENSEKPIETLMKVGYSLGKVLV
ncbi:phosphatidylserine decarboxylase-domain-containing protein [Phanerochaete sordida]|uniref:phosphatidylserine decarboxylase n=1 Tax=Phanerochaete sordida TaxID=48140 RepID=A0A9P3LDH2_9APHY|nr:phosphatidylserine decarboxylase-domain-containing protein [Phanerochaete sordida]